MPTKFTIQQGDITCVPSDLLLLKHAKGFHGGDLVVANELMVAGICSEKEISPQPDNFVIVETNQVIAPNRVLFVGTPPLRDFSYAQMYHFAARAIEILADEQTPIGLMTTTIHGVNYGLDAIESFQSLVHGFQAGLARHPKVQLGEICFVDKRERTVRILKEALDKLRIAPPPSHLGDGRTAIEKARPKPSQQDSKKRPVREETIEAEVISEPAKKHVFVAMPFSEEFQDIYEFGIYEPIRRCGYICERVDEPLFTGDILQRITERISSAEFVVAELTGARANVYLEVGYAWGKNVPVITVAREGEKLQFDVSTHRCIFYRTIGQLAKELEKLVRSVYKREDWRGKK
jgi:hypothetical protein